jgi:hypothetical protein
MAGAYKKQRSPGLASLTLAAVILNFAGYGKTGLEGQL